MNCAVARKLTGQSGHLSTLCLCVYACVCVCVCVRPSVPCMRVRACVRVAHHDKLSRWSGEVLKRNHRVWFCVSFVFVRACVRACVLAYVSVRVYAYAPMYVLMRACSRERERKINKCIQWHVYLHLAPGILSSARYFLHK